MTLIAKAGNTGRRGGQQGNRNAAGPHEQGARVMHPKYGAGTVTGANAQHTFVNFDNANPVDRMLGPRPVPHNTLKAHEDKPIDRYHGDEDVPLEHFQVGQKVRLAMPVGSSDWGALHEAGSEVTVSDVSQHYSPRAGKYVVHGVKIKEDSSGKYHEPFHFAKQK